MDNFQKHNIWNKSVWLEKKRKEKLNIISFTENDKWVLKTKCMEQNPSWDANRRSAISYSEEIIRLLRNPKVHYRFQFSESVWTLNA
jgi:hypothetical protein